MMMPFGITLGMGARTPIPSPPLPMDWRIDGSMASITAAIAAASATEPVAQTIWLPTLSAQMSPVSLLFNILWMMLAASIAISSVITAVIVAVTIIGIP